MEKQNVKREFKNNEKKILKSMLLVALVFTIKLFGGLMANSLALLSDSLHLITDFIALLISWYGLKIALKPANSKYTYGHYRHSILTALINNTFLIVISIYILYKAALRFMNPVAVESEAMIFFSALGIVVNSIILLTLRGSSNNLNVKSAFLHFIGDAVGDASVFIGAIVIYFTGINFIDTILSSILSVLILRSAIKMAIECIKILLEATPNTISVEEVTLELKAINKVVDIRDLHIWSLSKETIAMTAHICITEKNIDESEELLHEIQHMLNDKFNISHSTIQFEHSPCSSCYHNKPDHRDGCSMCVDCSLR